ncbi:hypothetical protein NPS01_25640 [Nocardioides psychrotolerans]|uniref:Uncharacterized protein n=1 Tax=Nocardioides psychrotolerans TaxID=1005945 RepID=A0A1I3LRN1_9ACTN|nr:hypothetical protein [Nocardioides psychrotolerans]GEP38901.1 hypothetical protein NPS01_25640 [Nocardioides psychrotolerans]SFI87454.1 hypothetical protein SAMN05216561_11469 [Nocardioides psychrotolerans]
MDPVLGTVVASFIAASASITIAIITSRNSAAMLEKEDKIRRQAKKITELGGDPDDV